VDLKIRETTGGNLDALILIRLHPFPYNLSPKP
jgi:hypothetical protein